MRYSRGPAQHVGKRCSDLLAGQRSGSGECEYAAVERAVGNRDGHIGKVVNVDAA